MISYKLRKLDIDLWWGNYDYNVNWRNLTLIFAEVIMIIILKLNHVSSDVSSPLLTNLSRHKISKVGNFHFCLRGEKMFQRPEWGQWGRGFLSSDHNTLGSMFEWIEHTCKDKRKGRSIIHFRTTRNVSRSSLRCTTNKPSELLLHLLSYI